MNAPVISESPRRLPPAVDRGRGFLDAMVPGWRDRVDPKELDMETNSCILGQVFGNYKKGLDELGLKNDRAAAFHGFYANGEMCSRWKNPWRNLNMLWRRELRT